MVARLYRYRGLIQCATRSLVMPLLQTLRTASPIAGVRGNNLPIILFPPDTRARAFHDSLLDFTRTKNAFEASASNSFERKGTRRDFVFFFARRVLVASSSPRPLYARFDFFGRHSSFLSERRQKEEERRRSKLRFGISNSLSEKKKEETHNNETTRRKPTRVAAHFARDERNVARFSSSRVRRKALWWSWSRS